MTPRTFPPAPGWSPDGHRIKAPLEYGRGEERVWVYGALRVRDGQARTLTAPSRNTAGWKRLLQAVERANPAGDLYVVSDNLSSHDSRALREWLVDHPRIRQVFTPKAPAGSTSKRAGGGCFAVRRWPASRLPTPVSSRWPPGWRPGSSTGAPGRGCGAARPRRPASYAGSSCTAFEERSTSSTPLGRCRYR